MSIVADAPARATLTSLAVGTAILAWPTVVPFVTGLN